MEKEDIKVDYDEEEDMFRLFRIGSQIKFSLDIELPQGDIVIDFDFNGKVVGLGFFNASSYFPILKESGISEIRVKMSVQYGTNLAQISYEIYSPKLEQLISNSIISPYNNELILEN